jgi:uncharacterized protein YbjT (DUF2867 family)
MAKKSQRTILITGATGTQGGAVLDHLRKNNAFSLRVMTRDPQSETARALVGHGLSVLQGDFDDPASLAKCLDEADGVFSVQDWKNGSEKEIEHGVALAEAANRAGVSQLVYSSVGSANRNTGIPHFDSKFQIEERIRAIGVPHTIFRPVFFMPNLLGQRDQIESGVFAFPLSPETRLQMIAPDDIGRFVAAAFEKPGKWLGKTLDIAGDELSMNEIAQAFSTLVGKPVNYQQIPWDKFEQQAGAEAATMFRWFEKVGYNVNLEELRHEMPNLTSFERWINTTWVQSARKSEAAATS